MESFRVPEVDMMTVSANSMKEREFLRKFVPQCGWNNVNPGSMYKVDKFYLDCQLYRDMFRDPYSRMLRPKYFNTYRGKCGVQIDKELVAMGRQPATHLDSIPPAFPIEYGHQMDFDRGFRMEGQHARTCVTAFRKR